MCVEFATGAHPSTVTSRRVLITFITIAVKWPGKNWTKSSGPFLFGSFRKQEGRFISLMSSDEQKNPLQEKFLVPMEVYKDMDILLIFCLIDLTNIIQPFRDRVDVFKMKPPEIDELIPWLRKICAAEGITVRDNNALKQVAVSADRLPRACLSLLQQAYFLGEPLSTSLVKELAQDIQGSVDRGPQYTSGE
jgi:DNA polymerase III delta prime subunit